MKVGLDHLPEGRRRELAFVVQRIREGSAFVSDRARGA